MPDIKEFKKNKLKKAMTDSFGAWKDEDHPELQKGAKQFVRTLRKSTKLVRSK